MRIYQDLYEAVKETERNLFEMGKDVSLHSMQNVQGEFDTKEIEGETFKVLNPLAEVDIAYEHMFTDPEGRKSIQKWALNEFYERVGLSDPGNPGKACEIRKDLWEPLLNAVGEMDYTYWERLANTYKIPTTDLIIEEFIRDPNSRRCVLNLWTKEIDLLGLENGIRVPCSITYSWLIRDGKLNMFYHMRSCDIKNHFINDLWLAGMYNANLVSMLKGTGEKPFQTLVPGSLTVTINSLHAYKNYLGQRNIF